jgi:hypothetical protein
MPNGNIDVCKWISCLGIIVAVILSVIILTKVDKKSSENYCSDGFAMLPDGDCIASQPYGGHLKLNKYGIAPGKGCKNCSDYSTNYYGEGVHKENYEYENNERIIGNFKEDYCVDISGGFGRGNCACDGGCAIIG